MKPSQTLGVKMIFVPMKDLKGVRNPSTEIECQNRIGPQVFSEDSQNLRRQTAWKNSGDIVWIPLENWKKTRKVSSLKRSAAEKKKNSFQE